MLSDTASPLARALAQITIADLWTRLRLPGKPGANCRSPFREDKHPSFAIYADGRRYHDHGTGEDGDAADFLAAACKASRAEGCRLLIAMAGTSGKTPGSATVIPQSVATAPAEKPNPLQDEAKAAERAGWPTFEPPTSREIAAIARLRDLSSEGVEAAATRGLLFCATWKCRRAWIVTDTARFNAQARRLDGEIWEEINDKVWSLRGSVAGWPVGLREAAARPAVALCEGGADMLAAFHLAWCADVLGNLGLCAIFGAANHITEDALPYFADKQVRIFAHDDPKGYEGAARWVKQLRAAGVTVDGFRFCGFRQANGDKVKDLNDFVRLDYDQWESERALVDSAFDFVPATPFQLHPKTNRPESR